MKLNSAVAAIVAATVMTVASGAAAAADGTLTFQGEVVAPTCNVTGGSGTDGANGDILVTLPKVSTASLDAAGAIAGSTPFELIVGGAPAGGTCDVAQVKTVMFELGENENIVPATGNLKNTDAAGATLVEIGLLNGDTNKEINLATATPADLPVAAVSGSEAIVKFVAQYEAVGAATAGKVTSTAQYSVVYN